MTGNALSVDSIPYGAGRLGILPLCGSARIQTRPFELYNRFMITLQIDKLLDDRTNYWLSQTTQIAHSTIQQLARHKTNGYNVRDPGQVM